MRIHIGGLQEVQLRDLVRIDGLCSSMYYEAGFDAAEVPARTEADFASLARRNSVRVLEADHAVAGFLAWHDESPGVALLVDIQVDPEHQRTGVGGRLVDAMRDEARNFHLEHIVVLCWEKATWAKEFYRKQRFMPIDATAPAKVLGWRDERLAIGKPLTRPGEVAFWSAVGAAPKLLPDNPDDVTLLTGAPPEE